MSTLLIVRQLFVKSRVAVVSVALLTMPLIIVGTVYAQPGGRAQGGMRGQPPQTMDQTPEGEQPDAYVAPQTPQVRGTQTVRTLQSDGGVVTETTTGDDVAVVVTAAPQGGQPQMRVQGGQGQVGNQQYGQTTPGQVQPWQPGQDQTGPGQGGQGQGFRPGGQGGPGQGGPGQGGPGQGGPGQGRQPGQGGPGQPGQGGQGTRPGQGGQQPVLQRNRPTDNSPNPDLDENKNFENFMVTGENKRLRFGFKGAAWRIVIEWFAREADLTLELESAPPGSFSYFDETGKDYSVDETFSLLNSYLIRRNFLMFRTAKLLMLVNLADGIPTELIRDVPLDQLNEVGDYEVVRVIFKLTGTTPDVIQAEIQQFLGPQGLIVTLPKSQQIYVTEFGDKLRTIREIIRGIDDPSVISVVERVTLENLAADIAVTQLKQLLTLSDTDATLRVLIDPTGISIWLYGRIDRVNAAKHVLQKIDIPMNTKDVTLEVYPIPSADPRTVLSVVQTLLAGRPDVRAQLDANTGALVVQGRPEDHQKVKDAIERLEGPGYRTEAIQLTRLSTTAAKEAIDNFFTPSATQQRSFGSVGGTTTNTTTVPAPIVMTAPTLKQLIIKGTESQITQIKMLLTQLGESNLLPGASVNQRNLVDQGHVPMTEKEAQYVFQMAEQVWMQMERGQINVMSSGQRTSPLPGNRATPYLFNNTSSGQQSSVQFGSQEQSDPQIQLLNDLGYQVHVIDGGRDENSPREIQSPRQIPMQNNLPPGYPQQPGPSQNYMMPAPGFMQPGNPVPQLFNAPINNAPINNAPINNAPINNAPINTTISNNSVLNMHLDNLFGPAEVTPVVPATVPVSAPSSATSAELQNVPPEGHLTTQTLQISEHAAIYVPVAYRQVQPATDESVIEPADDEFVTKIADEAVGDVVSQVVADTSETSDSFVLYGGNQRQVFGIVPDETAGIDSAVTGNPQFLSQRLQRPMNGVAPQPNGVPDAGQPAREPYPVFQEPESVSRDIETVSPINPPSPPGRNDVRQGGISVSTGPAGVVVTGPPDDVADFVDLIQMFANEGLLKAQSTEFYLIKNAKADTIKTMLNTLLGSSNILGSSSDPLAGITNDPMQAMVQNMIGGSKIQATGPYDIYVDTRSNMLIINANPVDHLTIQELLPILDRLGRSDDVMINAKPHMIKLEYMKAEEAETQVRTLFAENLQGANRGGGGAAGGARPGQPGQQQNPLQMLMTQGGATGMSGMMQNPMFQQMMQTRGGNQQQQEVQTMTLAVEKTTNSLIVFSPEELFIEVEGFVKMLDQSAQSQEPTTGMVYVGNNSPSFYNNMLRSMLGSSVTVSNQSTTGSNRTGGGGGGNMGGGARPGGAGGMTFPGGGGMTFPGGGGNMGGGARPGGGGGVGGFGGIQIRPGG